MDVRRDRDENVPCAPVLALLDHLDLFSDLPLAHVS